MAGARLTSNADITGEVRAQVFRLHMHKQLHSFNANRRTLI